MKNTKNTLGYAAIILFVAANASLADKDGIPPSMRGTWILHTDENRSIAERCHRDSNSDKLLINESGTRFQLGLDLCILKKTKTSTRSRFVGTFTCSSFEGTRISTEDFQIVDGILNQATEEDSIPYLKCKM
jgi:hypothetical protein